MMLPENILVYKNQIPYIPNPQLLLKSFIARVVPPHGIFYGIICHHCRAKEEDFFWEIYQDGDYQKLTMTQVLQSRVLESGIEPQIVNRCRRYALLKAAITAKRLPLPMSSVI